MPNLLSLPHFQQSADGYCLPACARMVLAYLGINRSEPEISRTLGTQLWGTPSFAIQRLADAKIEVVYREWSVSDLIATLTAEQPVITFVRTGFPDYYQDDFAHTVVATGVSQDKQFWIHDPLQVAGPVVVSWNGLLAAWAEFALAIFQREKVEGDYC